MTSRQATIFRILKEGRRHLTAEEILARARHELPTLALGTVYRNLKLLVEAGKIRHLTMDGKDLYDGFTAPHDHLVCALCGRVADIAPLRSHEQIEKELGMKIEGYELMIYHVCNDCQKKEK